MGMLNNKKILITGIANKLSIGYGIASAMHREGAELALTFQNEKLKDRVLNCAKELNIKIVLPCDVSKDENIKNLFIELYKKWEKFDGFIHSIAFAPSNQLSGNYIDAINRDGFNIAHNISSYSFVALAKESKNMLNKNSSLTTISYIGSKIAVPNYNVMGLAKASLEANVKYMASSMGKNSIRVNAISSGPIKTLASYGIKNFREMLKNYKKVIPLRRLITIEEIGNVAAFLSSDFSSGITGQTIYVDGGFNISSII